MSTPDTGIVNIHGKDYKTVAKRVDEFRAEYKQDFSIITELISRDENTVVMKAEILDKERNVIATGYAEENRTASTINRTSAVENCETSAIGRALANFGLAGGEYASADEVAQAINQQGNYEPPRSGDRLDFDEVWAALDAIDDEASIDEYAKEIKDKYPKVTPKQADALKKMFDARRRALN